MAPCAAAARSARRWYWRGAAGIGRQAAPATEETDQQRQVTGGRTRSGWMPIINHDHAGARAAATMPLPGLQGAPVDAGSHCQPGSETVTAPARQASGLTSRSRERAFYLFSTPSDVARDGVTERTRRHEPFRPGYKTPSGAAGPVAVGEPVV